MQDTLDVMYCVHCRREIAAGIAVCPHCGGEQRKGAPPPRPAQEALPQAIVAPVRLTRAPGDRPLGVAILAVLFIISAGWLALGMVAGLVHGSMSAAGALMNQGASAAGHAPDGFSGMRVLMFVLSVAWILVSAAVGYGLWQMEKWARIGAIALFALGLVSMVRVLLIAMHGSAGAIGGLLTYMVILGVVPAIGIYYLVKIGPDYSG